MDSSSHDATTTIEQTESAPEYVALYRRAFAEYKTQALWNLRSFELPTAEDARVVARALRVEGDMQARALAEQIERACRAAH